MSSQVQTAACFALLIVASVSAMPQVWNIGFVPQEIRNPVTVPNDSSTISSTAAPPTTPSPAQYFDCLGRCPVTSEYNPICGSDDVNYLNLGKLQCAARCGLNVTMVRAGTCRPL